MSYAKGKNFNVVFLPLQYSAGDTYRGSGLVFSVFSVEHVIFLNITVFCFYILASGLCIRVKLVEELPEKHKVSLQ